MRRYRIDQSVSWDTGVVTPADAPDWGDAGALGYLLTRLEGKGPVVMTGEEAGRYAQALRGMEDILNDETIDRHDVLSAIRSAMQRP